MPQHLASPAPSVKGFWGCQGFLEFQGFGELGIWGQGFRGSGCRGLGFRELGLQAFRV